ncbi:hypothetical protein CR513_55504, partial [Mucuna pruriens]
MCKFQDIQQDFQCIHLKGSMRDSGTTNYFDKIQELVSAMRACNLISVSDTQDIENFATTIWPCGCCN